MLKRLASVGPIRCCYEAGPTGFALRRALQKEGIECVVIAPSLTPKQPGDRVKTDRRDAEKLARFHRSGDLTEVYVPDETTEAMRDLERAREDAKRAQGTARRQLHQFLLRHGRRYEGKTAWTGQHMEWIRYLKFDHEAHNRVLVDYVAAVENATARLVALTKDIVEIVETWSLRPLVKALQALRGVQLLTAVTLVAEIGDFARFASAPKLMAYLGLVPSEHSSGDMTRRGRITRCGKGTALPAGSMSVTPPNKVPWTTAPSSFVEATCQMLKELVVDVGMPLTAYMQLPLGPCFAMTAAGPAAP